MAILSHDLRIITSAGHQYRALAEELGGDGGAAAEWKSESEMRIRSDAHSPTSTASHTDLKRVLQAYQLHFPLEKRQTDPPYQSQKREKGG